MKLRSFQSRILVYFLSLMAVVQLFGFSAFNAALTSNTRDRIAGDLDIGSRVFKRLLNDRTAQLAATTRLLSDDYAFKRALATNDRGTALSALANHQARIKADLMYFISLDDRVIADTTNRQARGEKFAFPGLTGFAVEHGGAASIVFIGERAYQLVLVPLLAPEPVALLGAGFRVDEKLANSLKEITLSHVSFTRELNNKWILLAGTLPDDLKPLLVDALGGQRWENERSASLKLAEDEYVSLVIPWGDKENYSIKVVLQRSLQEELKPYLLLRATLYALFLIGFVGTIAGAILISRSVTSPVKTLVEGVRKISAGDFGHVVKIDRHDEIGELADSFNEMTKGLADRDRVRDMLGKVVSPEVAEELMRKGVELGGEEREVTILFSDIRNFTSLSERMPPGKLLEALNEYFTRMSGIIESNGGVVDKYVGDAIMALFGAPVHHDDDADRAVRSAVEMLNALEEMQWNFQMRGIPALRIGIGINTATVVAGNVGSQSRLNYTVIGDGVNVASRLESLTKDTRYNARIIVSEATMNKLIGDYKSIFLEEITVRGKRDPVRIFSIQPEKT